MEFGRNSCMDSCTTYRVHFTSNKITIYLCTWDVSFIDRTWSAYLRFTVENRRRKSSIDVDVFQYIIYLQKVWGKERKKQKTNLHNKTSRITVGNQRFSLKARWFFSCLFVSFFNVQRLFNQTFHSIIFFFFLYISYSKSDWPKVKRK
jgi:hypothetical protein